MTAKTFTIAASGGDYTSISGYVTGEAENLVAGGHTHTITMDIADLNDNSAFVGFVADPTNFVKFVIQSGREHGGQVGNFVIANTGEDVFRPVSTLDGMIFDGLGIQSGTTTCISRANNCDGFILDNLFCEVTGTSTDVYDLLSGTSNLHEIRNCFSLGGSDGFIGSTGMEFEFCSALNSNSRGFVLGKFTNCISMDSGGDDFEQESSGSDHLLSSDLTADDVATNAIISEASSDIFLSVTDGLEDLNLKNGTNAANGAGVVISGITEDYEGTVRADPPDIGADEFVAGGLAIPIADHYYRRMRA